jgi:cytochrome c oxidase subunit 2
VRYLDATGETDFVTANEIRIPVGRVVALELKTADVIHSFWAPALAGKLDMVPGRTNRLRIMADRPGTFRGQCAEYCGGPHAWMAFHVVAEDEKGFDAWVRRQREPAHAPDEEQAVRGARLFARLCAACHTVRGTEAAGSRGPDLTHLASRSTIAAGALQNNAGTLAAWIVQSQHLKPGNLMPSFQELGGEELQALATYLHGLH